MISTTELEKAMQAEVVEENNEHRLSAYDDVSDNAMMSWALDYAMQAERVEPPDADEILFHMISYAEKTGLLERRPTRAEALLAFHMMSAVTLGIRLGRENPA